MKKVILSLAIFAATSLSMMAANDNNANAGNNEKARTECAKNNKGECNKGECPGKKGNKGECSDKKGCKGMKAFEGLNLTDAQKTKLEALRKECKAKKEAGMKKGNKQKDKKDQLTAEQKQQLKAEKKAKKMEAKQNFLNGVKSILTPEQYTQFLENNFKMADNGHHAKGMKKVGKHGKDRKAMHAKKGNKDHSGKKTQKNNANQKNNKVA